MRNGRFIFRNAFLFADLPISQIVFYAIIDNPEKTCYNYLCWCAESTLSGCGAVGSVLPWGGRGRPFKSGHSDQNQHAVSKIFRNCVFCFVWENSSTTLSTTISVQKSRQYKTGNLLLYCRFCFFTINLVAIPPNTQSNRYNTYCYRCPPARNK